MTNSIAMRHLYRLLRESLHETAGQLPTSVKTGSAISRRLIPWYSQRNFKQRAHGDVPGVSLICLGVLPHPTEHFIRFSHE